MTSCGPVTFFVFINLKLHLNGCYLCQQHACSAGYLSKTKGPNLRKYSSLFSTQLYRTNVANLPNWCNIFLTVMLSVQSDVRNIMRHVVTDCLKRIKILELLRPFVLLLRHEYCLVKNIKSMRELVMVRNKKRNSRSFM
jgi:hypothetical protein